MKTITKEQLQEVLRKHKLWLGGKEGGERADLSYHDLRGADLDGADLCNADLKDADLCNANLRSADLRSADLRDANLSYSDLRGANLSCADLRGANLSNTDLRYVDFRHAILSNTDLRYVDFRHADLRYAALEGATFSGSNLEGVLLDKTCQGNSTKVESSSGDNKVPSEQTTGYHKNLINKGVIGEISKIQEELEEVIDASDQGIKLMIGVELSDLIGAIEMYSEKHLKLSLQDLIDMKNVTKRAFESGHRK